jgi:polysaccharide deacetylase family protein (PEP-CTERM system associated)
MSHDPYKRTGKMLNAISIDVEDYFQVAALSKAVKRDAWDTQQLRVEKNTRQLLNIFDEYSVKSTFFVLGWIAEHCPGLVREIADRGHEIACHGYSHELIYKQTPDDFRQETVRAKSTLEDQCQLEVSGYRAASYSITKKSLWALDILAEAGFKYDSSIFPVRHDFYGIPDAPVKPHKLETPKGYTLIEFPPTVLNIFNYSLPVSGGGYFRLFPYTFTRFAFRRINANGRNCMFYLHPWEIDPQQPKLKVGLRSRFRHYNNLGRCEQRLKQLLDDFEFTTVREVLETVGLVTTDPDYAVAV